MKERRFLLYVKTLSPLVELMLRVETVKCLSRSRVKRSAERATQPQRDDPQ